MRKVYSEAKLALTDLWFTGKEWANGTAARILRRQQYNARQAEVAAQESKRKANPPAKVTYESGLSPIQACAKAMRQDVTKV